MFLNQYIIFVVLVVLDMYAIMGVIFNLLDLNKLKVHLEEL